VLTFEQIKELIQLVADRRLSGMEIERSGFRLRVDGQAVVPVAVAPAPVAPVHAPAAPPVVAAPPPAVPSESSPAAEPAAASDALPAGAFVQRSPMVGTFYRSPNPEAPSFVEVGQRVKRGQTLCILEAMKLMNEIEAEADGVVTQIYPQNATAVEFGEPLFVIVP
jgi:acetyl-CoA carboxylase biotin carboxyl carrier protein